LGNTLVTALSERDWYVIIVVFFGGFHTPILLQLHKPEDIVVCPSNDHVVMKMVATIQTTIEENIQN